MLESISIVTACGTDVSQYFVRLEVCADVKRFHQETLSAFHVAVIECFTRVAILGIRVCHRFTNRTCLQPDELCLRNWVVIRDAFVSAAR